MRPGYTMSPWLFNVYMDEVMKEIKLGIGRKGESGDGGSARCGRGIGV